MKPVVDGAAGSGGNRPGIARLQSREQRLFRGRDLRAGAVAQHMEVERRRPGRRQHAVDHGGEAGERQRRRPRGARRGRSRCGSTIGLSGGVARSAGLVKLGRVGDQADEDEADDRVPEPHQRPRQPSRNRPRKVSDAADQPRASISRAMTSASASRLKAFRPKNSARRAAMAASSAVSGGFQGARPREIVRTGGSRRSSAMCYRAEASRASHVLKENQPLMTEAEPMPGRALWYVAPDIARAQASFASA